MSKCVSAGLPAGVVACVFFYLMSPGWTQEVSPAPMPLEADNSETEETPAPSGDGTSLPGIVVTTPTGGGSGPGQAGGGASETADEETPEGVVLGGKAISDTGTTVYSSSAVQARTLGGGDANTFVRNAPNIQYQNETSEDTGTNPYREIDTKPLLFSISGGKTYQNNIILNGISINNVVNPIEDSDAKLDDDPYPVVDVLYGVHPQTIYVPAEFVDQATIVDSNASAKYGEFLGGAVIYDLALPPTDRWRATFSYERHTDDWVNYRLGTEDKTNPLDRAPPEFTKDNVAMSLGGPITSSLSTILQYSGKFAETKQQKEYEFFNEWVGMESENHFFRFAAIAKTDIGRFKFDTSLTDYAQSWESESSRDLFIDVKNHSQTTQLEHKIDLPQLDYSGLNISRVNVTSRAFYNDSEYANESNSNESWFWVAIKRSKGRNDPPSAWETTFDSELTDEFCRPTPIESYSDTATSANVTCREGGWGSLYTTQTDYGFQNEVTGNFLWGQFLLGGEAKRIKGTRERPEDFTYYSSFTTLVNGSDVTSFNCPPEHPACTEEQYARIWITQPAFDIEAAVNTVNLYSEIDQTVGWLNVRAGVRFDYEDYFKNPNFAPRLAASLTPINWFSVTGGYNRYYDGATLVYAIRDAQPRAITNTLSGSADDEGNVPSTWTSRVNTPYSYRSAGLDTPYKDEYTAGIRVKEPLFGGNFRIRYLERYGKDEFSREACPETSSSLCNTLSNNGESTYESWTGEYTTWWSNPNHGALSHVGFTGTVTWSEQSAYRGTYFDEDGSEEYIYYNGQRYTQEGFVAVSGNLDIPVRIGATLQTLWMSSRLAVNLHAGFNFAYEGVYDTDEDVVLDDGLEYNVYADKSFDPTLTLDLQASYAFTEYSTIELQLNNLTDSIGNSVASTSNPWVRGRSFWLGTKLRM